MNAFERTIPNGNVVISAQAYGSPDHSPVLLIMGQMASMLWWPEGFCRKLARTGRFVVRYDHRDVGLSTTYPPGGPPYSMDDLADDAVAVLDGFDLDAAHLVGMSLGGIIGQIIALTSPERVLSLTAMSSSPVGIDTAALPSSTEAYMTHAAAGADVDWSTQEAIDFVVKDMAMIASTRHPHDPAKARAFVELDYARSGGYLSATNHFMLEDRGVGRPSLSSMRPSMLVIHGTSDPIFPIEHGEALAEAVPDGRLVRIDGGGHEVHEDDWDAIIDAIAKHTAPP